MDNSLILMVIETTAARRATTIYSLLLKERIVFPGHADQRFRWPPGRRHCSYSTSKTPSAEIQLYLNCPGGEIYPGLAIY